jgi:hypothetical protein
MRSNTDSCTSTQTDPDEGQAPGPSWARSRLATWLLKSGYDGTVWANRDGAVTWTAEVETMDVDDAGRWWVSVHGGAISRSDDQGVTRLEAYVPPARP